ncbi:MAG: DUF2147 domain-containing protein [Paludibacteraceae bacterium]|jgi:uncharacterized protein (DUF2147 family)|nr:DUF2147 domain-containing protein [Paludibacteraceae bacterium]MED9995325.1 DUF2147 domain-containing protein [Paludibacteraceae bacterium]
MKRKIGLLTLLGVFCLTIWANPDDICGVWLDDNKDGKTLFYKKAEGKYEAQLIWLADSLDSSGKPLRDKRNPDKAQRNDLLIGKNVMQMDWSEEEQCYILHYAYDPKWGMTGTGKMWVKGDVMTIKAGKWGIRVTRTMDRVE